ncbi:hypothetical protein H5410_006474 [Solanum commersonii]|uniref:Uncharacterized protein n=1 Tax=Solanum commersonii TaxID=4109 RepID=A0A9J6A9Y1_SOLCO|nr:hypothetical protein H5410_006474 [Solanum commersonii]
MMKSFFFFLFQRVSSQPNNKLQAFFFSKSKYKNKCKLLVILPLLPRTTAAALAVSVDLCGLLCSSSDLVFPIGGSVSHAPHRLSVGGLRRRDLAEQVVEVRRINDSDGASSLVIGGSTLSVISAYAPAGFEKGGEAKSPLYEWSRLLDFAKALSWVIELMLSSKKENHLVTFVSPRAKTFIDYLPLGKGDRGLFKDAKRHPK